MMRYSDPEMAIAIFLKKGKWLRDEVEKAMTKLFWENINISPDKNGKTLKISNCDVCENTCELIFDANIQRSKESATNIINMTAIMYNY